MLPGEIVYSRFANITSGSVMKKKQNLYDQYEDVGLSLIATQFDREFYLSAYPDVKAAGLDPVLHYNQHGWREGRNPNPWFNTSWYIGEYPDVLNMKTNPFLHYLRCGRDQGRQPHRPGGYKRDSIDKAFRNAEEEEEPQVVVSWLTGERDSDILTEMVREFDTKFYLEAYPDVKAAGIDPIVHYMKYGHNEGRNPNSWFNTNWYVDEYPDVRKIGMNPFLHYISLGRNEGRRGGPRTLDAARLERLVLSVCYGARGLVLSISHDCYIRVTGGMQNLIGDEQELFNANGFAYLHISPSIVRLKLASEVGDIDTVQVLLNGKQMVVAGVSDFEAAIRSIVKGNFSTVARFFVVHSVLGHCATVLSRLASALAPRHSFFWLHDYSALCEGYKLLRNDVEYCHAPAITSNACQICVYGRTRALYLRMLSDLFDAVSFHIIAPSRAALEIYVQATQLPYVSVRVHENATFLPKRRHQQRSSRGVESDPIRIAFAGYPATHKGWPLFVRLVRHLRDHTAYRFYQFAETASLTPMDGVTCVPVRVDRQHRSAMIDALALHEIDFVLVLSPWPETFSYVCHEAFAAGADVVALPHGGNAADAVRRHARGVVLADDDAVLEFFADGYALNYELQRANVGIESGALLYSGTTATLSLGADDLGDRAESR